MARRSEVNQKKKKIPLDLKTNENRADVLFHHSMHEIFIILQKRLQGLESIFFFSIPVNFDSTPIEKKKISIFSFDFER